MMTTPPPAGEAADAEAAPEAERRHYIRFGKRKMPLPNSRWARIALGTGLMICGILGALPILGFWMLPLGMIVLSADSPVMRRVRRRIEVRFGRWRDRRKEARGGAEPN